MKFVIVGGGIAGVSCASRLQQFEDPEDDIVLISGSGYVKCISKLEKVGQFTEFLEVETVNNIAQDKRIRLIFAKVVEFSPQEKKLLLNNGEIVFYDKLCIATGATPKVTCSSRKHHVLRDTDTVKDFSKSLQACKSIAIVGNGGIATDLIYEIGCCHLDWIIKDKSISSTWFIPEVEQFLESRLKAGRTDNKKIAESIVGTTSFSSSTADNGVHGCAPGPDWKETVSFLGSSDARDVRIYRNCVITDIRNEQEQVELITSNNDHINADIVLWATGVEPDSQIWSKCGSLKIADDGGILVDNAMKTSIDDVYACGDVCTPSWIGQSENWKQMRTWTQARQMGDYCARSMSSKVPGLDLDFCFEVFAHATYLFGYRCIFLGDFKGERHENWYIRERIIEEDSYVCCIMKDHRVVGATLIGETELEETLENLILNRTSLELIEENFLDPNIDIQDFFD
ncbi:unnamed protein product [Auanema sp. JU1783]|nr:unnamed protein product [Auanema sp. JU1783]